jgi:hypothetical protein
MGDFEDVIREETARGRRRYDTEARRLRRQRLQEVGKLLRAGTEEELRNALRAHEVNEGTPEYEEILQIWRTERPS